MCKGNISIFDKREDVAKKIQKYGYSINEIRRFVGMMLIRNLPFNSENKDKFRNLKKRLNSLKKGTLARLMGIYAEYESRFGGRSESEIIQDINQAEFINLFGLNIFFMCIDFYLEVTDVSGHQEGAKNGNGGFVNGSG